MNVVAAEARTGLAMRTLLFLTAVAFYILSTSDAEAQFQCPPGSRPVAGGGGIMCQCPDGSYAGLYSGCKTRKTQPEPSGVHCGGGQYCPHGTECCPSHNQCCSHGNFCSAHGCIQQGSVDCGGYYCAPGKKCASKRGCLDHEADDCGNGHYCGPGFKCSNKGSQISCVISLEDAFRNHAATLAQHLKSKGALLKGSIAERHEKGWDYVKSDQQVNDSIENLVKLQNAYKLGSTFGTVAGGGFLKAQDVWNTLQGAFKDYQLLMSQDHYGATLAIMRDASAQFLGKKFDLPPGSTELVTVLTAATTAYTYGFFFAP
jgi:hypothetical protein